MLNFVTCYIKGCSCKKSSLTTLHLMTVLLRCILSISPSLSRCFTSKIQRNLSRLDRRHEVDNKSPGNGLRNAEYYLLTAGTIIGKFESVNRNKIIFQYRKACIMPLTKVRGYVLHLRQGRLRLKSPDKCTIS